MDEPTGYALSTALDALGFAFSLIALAASGLVWWLSRAGQVRAFESRVYAQLTNANSRIEQVEASWREERAHLDNLVDEITTGATRTFKERQRLAQENKRAEVLAGVNGAEGAPADISTLPRAEQLSHVRAFFAAGR